MIPDSLTCDYLGRKFAIVVTTVMIVLGGILATASTGPTVTGMFWMMTVVLPLQDSHRPTLTLYQIARGIVGFGAGGIPNPTITPC